MIYIEELKLNLTEAKIAFEQLPRDQQINNIWSDWFADFMIKSGMIADRDELAALIREADNDYHIEPEQHPWIDYISRYINEKLRQ